MFQSIIQVIQVIVKESLNSQTVVKISFSTLVALISYLIFSRVSNYWLRNVLQKVVEKRNMKKSKERQIKNWSLFVDRTGGVVILFVFVLNVLSDLNFNIAPLLTSAGIFGLAIGLGSQNLMKDIVGGIFIFLEGNYSEGDKVRIAGVSGKVKKINLRKIILESEEDKSFHIIPNSEVKVVTVFPKELLPYKKTKGLLKKKNVVKVRS